MTTDFASQIKWDLIPYCYGEGMDIGCGDARPHDFMLGIDIAAGQTGRGPNLIKDARDLSMFSSESQDYIFSSYLLNELEDWPKVLEGWWRLLKQDGYLIVFLPVVEGDKPCNPKMMVDAMVPLRPWQLVEARIGENSQFFHVYRKCDRPAESAPPDPDKICAVMKLGAHGDALWASSVFPHLKEQGYYTILYTQATGEEVLRHDPNIDRIVCFESRVPMGQLGELFHWLESKYKHSRILIECVEGTLLPSPQKIQYHFPKDMREKLMSFNYLEMHHRMARVPLEPRLKFYPNDEEKRWANDLRVTLTPFVVVLVPNGSSLSKMWPYAGDLAKRLLERPDVTVVFLGDDRGTEFEDHPRLLKIGLKWTVRQAMTFCQLANAVVGQETGLLNSVSFEPDVRKVVLLSHSNRDNLTRDWPNTATLMGDVPCAPCHRLHYNWEYCPQDKYTQAAACQTAIGVVEVLREIQPAIEIPKAA